MCRCYSEGTIVPTSRKKNALTEQKADNMSKPRQLYMDVASHANAPLSKRKKVAEGRGGERKVPRRYHLMADEIVLLRKNMEEAGRFISPYGPGRLYSFIIDSLVSLGVGDSHAFIDVYSKFIELASHENTRDNQGRTLWERFSSKISRNTETGRCTMGKFMQNIEVLQRLGGDHPYAFKLSQLGACIDIFIDANRQVRIQLRTGIPDGEPVRPVNTNRKRKYTKTLDSVLAGTVIPDNRIVDSPGEDSESTD